MGTDLMYLKNIPNIFAIQGAYTVDVQFGQIAALF